MEIFHVTGVFLPAATKLGQGNVFTDVCDSVHKGGAGTPPGNTPPGSRLQDTVYERPVRILLECILVFIYRFIHFKICLSCEKEVKIFHFS